MGKPIFYFTVIRDVHITNWDVESHQKLERTLNEVAPGYQT